MTTFDPRRIAHALDDLSGLLSRWSSAARDTLETAELTQRHSREAVERAMHTATIILDRAKDDQAAVYKTHSAVEAAFENSRNAIAVANDTLKNAEKLFLEADETLAKWQGELQEAITWLAQAQARLNKALQELERARELLRSAERELEYANSNYRRCLNVKVLTNCSGEAAALSRAQANFNSASNHVNGAIVEVEAAKEEVRQAELRVTCCQRAVEFAAQAVNLAGECVSAANESLNSAERSCEFAEAANRLIGTAERSMLAECESADKAIGEARLGQEASNEAAVFLQHADRAEYAAQTYSKSVGRELEIRTQQLLNLNRPDLGMGDWTLPKNVSPSEIKVIKRPDGKTSIIYGNKRDQQDNISSPHGHTVVDESSNIDDTRTQKGSIQKDSGK